MKVSLLNDRVLLLASSSEYCCLNNIMNEVLHGFNPGDLFDVSGREGDVARGLLASFGERCDEAREMYLSLAEIKTLLKVAPIVGGVLKGRHLRNRVGITHDELHRVIEDFEAVLKM